MVILAARTNCAPPPTEVPPNFMTRGLSKGSRSVQRCIEIVQYVVDRLEADGEPDVVVRDAGGLLLVHRELRVGRGGRMNDQALRVPDVRQETVQCEPVYKALARLETAFDAETEDRTVEPTPVVLRG